MADEKHSRAKAGMGGSKKSSSKKSGDKKIHETHIKHFKHGGHVVTHHYKSDEGAMPEPGEPEVMADKNALMSHLQDTIPDNGAAQATPPEPQAAAGPAPAPAAPAAPPQGM